MEIEEPPFPSAAATYCGRPVHGDGSPPGPLREFGGQPLYTPRRALKDRLDDDGYLLLRGLMDLEAVEGARVAILAKLRDEGLLSPDHPWTEAVPHPGQTFSFRPDLVRKDPAVNRLLKSGPIIRFFRHLFGETVRPLDFVWLRTKTPGLRTATHPHCDTVYMNRGTVDHLYTAWTPLHDVPVGMGPLMVLEGSHRRADKLADYWASDVDATCVEADAPPPPGAVPAHGRKPVWNPAHRGAYDIEAAGIPGTLGGRWLTTDFRAGDVMVFTMRLLHASLDNRTDRIRLSTDSRYQPDSEPADPRWVGVNPIGHGAKAHLDMIC